jgi:hypothetical protein
VAVVLGSHFAPRSHGERDRAPFIPPVDHTSAPSNATASIEPAAPFLLMLSFQPVVHALVLVVATGAASLVAIALIGTFAAILVAEFAKASFHQLRFIDSGGYS